MWLLGVMAGVYVCGIAFFVGRWLQWDIDEKRVGRGQKAGRGRGRVGHWFGDEPGQWLGAWALGGPFLILGLVFAVEALIALADGLGIR